MNYDNPKTLREYKPAQGVYAHCSHACVYCEIAGWRFFYSHEENGWIAEQVASENIRKFPSAVWFVADRYDSTHIDGNQKDFRKFYERRNKQ